MTDPSQRALAKRSALQAGLLILALMAPSLGLLVQQQVFGTGDAESTIMGLVWGAVALLPIAIVFALTCQGSAMNRALRGGQFIVAVAAIWICLFLLGQVNSF